MIIKQRLGFLVFWILLQSLPIIEATSEHLNGFETEKGNYLWGGALTLAWKQLSKTIIKQPIKLFTDDDQNALNMAENFNKISFNSQMLSENCYYARSGFGNKAVMEINKEVALKFPEKTTEKIEANLELTDIISYAFFLKILKFRVPFDKKVVQFNQKNVSGFAASKKAQKDQILVHNYKDQENFIIELLTQQKNDHIFIIKSSQKFQPEQAIQKINPLSQGQPFKYDDQFQMPIISIKQKRDVQQLIGKYLANERFQGYYFSKLSEIINFDIDETGAKVQNEGIVGISFRLRPRNFTLNKPFWIIMRQNRYHPYFVAYIQNVNDRQL